MVDATLQHAASRLEQQLATLAQLEHHVTALERAGTAPSAPLSVEEGKEAARLAEENDKLRYQLVHLERNVQLARDAVASSTTLTAPKAPEFFKVTQVDGKSVNLLLTVRDYFAAGMSTLEGFEESDVIVALGRQSEYQCNSAMAMAKKLKKKPRDMAQTIVDSLPKSDFVDRVEIAGPGFINVWIKTSWMEDYIKNQLCNGIQPPQMEREGLTAVVDFSSPNIAKQMHVGHLRSTIIGDAICRLLEFCGVNVLRMNHVGDWGTQFGMLIAHLEDKFPDYKAVSPPVGDLQAFYKESKLRFDEDEAFKARAYKRVVALQAGDADVTLAWRLICEVSRQEFSKIYERLNIRIEEKGESFYQPFMPATVQALKDMSLVKEEEGRLLMFTDYDKVPLTVVKSDGGFTYATSDLTALRYRVDEQKADWCIYVVDNGQALHLNSVYAGARMAGWYTPETSRIEHVGFGVVLGENGKKFKTRSGDTVKLSDLLDEAVSKATAVLKEKERDQVLNEAEMQTATIALAYGSVKYADLSKNRTSDYVFSFDKMLAFNGNTAVYILFAYMRCASIARKAGVDVDQHVRSAQLTLKHPKELQLAFMLLRFAEVVDVLVKTLELHHMCDYLYKLSGIFTEFYDQCRVINEDGKPDMSRLLLTEATARTTRKGLDILGIPVAEKL